MDMNDLRIVKAFFIGLFAFISSALGAMAIPVYIMIAMSLTDYVTGLIAAPRRGQIIDSKIALYGVIKKVAIWLLVYVGWIIDILLDYMIKQFGVGIQINFLVAAIVAVWLSINEIISVLENINDIGAPVPKFMADIMKYLKTEVEDITGENEE